MNRKLLVLNIALGAAVIYAGIEFHSEWVAAKARQVTMPGPAPKAAAVPAVPPLPRQPPVLAAGYKEVAQKDLFDVSRNPNLPLPEPEKPAPPPVPPPLPAFHGMMDFGDPQGPVALITEAETPGHEEKHAGEMVGAFKLVAFDRQEMTLEWQGKVIHKRLNEGGGEVARAPKPQAGGPEPPAAGVIPGQAQQQPAEQPKPQGGDLGPGTVMTDTVRACQAGDSAAAGTVNNGFVKQITVSPMGPQCLWRAVGK